LLAWRSSKPPIQTLEAPRQPEGVGVDHKMLAVAPLLGRIGLLRLACCRAIPPTPTCRNGNVWSCRRSSIRSSPSGPSATWTRRSPAALDQVRGAGGVAGKPLAVVLGSRGDGSIQGLRDLIARQAAPSTNSETIVVAGATHAGLVDNRTYALQTSNAIVQVIRAVRSGTPMVSSGS
jgi:hypothetical protein